jgi:hypothetical protein
MKARRLGFWVAVGGLFALTYGQAPLYTSNQNQYFLHGLAAAGDGHLAQDWLAGTQDPTPVFSALVQMSFAWLGPLSFYLEYGVLLGAYLWGLFAIVSMLFPKHLNTSRRLMVVTVLMLIHSDALRYTISRLPWTDGGYLLEGGVAGQRLLGTVLEPSSFGALLVLSIAFFLRDRPHWAAVLAAGAACVHPTYLLTAGTLVLAYMGLLTIRDHRPRLAITSGGLALIGVLPILVHTAGVFGLNSSQVAADAARVLVEFRIPHHAMPAQWLDPSVAIKLLVVLGAMLTVRRSRLLPILSFPAAVGLALTLVQVATGNDRLALLFPWRVSTVLVPVSSTILATRALVWGFDWLDQRDMMPSPSTLGWAWATLAILALSGSAAFLVRLQNKRQAPEQTLFAEVRHMAAPGQVFLIPPKLQDFRLATGQPAYIDFKSIPYQPGEVLEWYDRVRLAQFFYRDDLADVNCHLIEQAAQAGITHVVLAEPQLGLDCDGLLKLWGNEAFEIDRLEP